MNRLAKSLRAIALTAVAALALDAGANLASDAGLVASGGILVSEAGAVVGAPATPLSVAGVARRTARRTVHATTTYVAVLPQGCTTTVINGSTIHQCGATYYQQSGNQYVVVTID